MTFEWDEEKRRANIRKHGFDFADPVEMFPAQCWSTLIRGTTARRLDGRG